MNIEQSVIKHYGREGLADSILARARKRAESADSLTTDDLAPFDEMHVGGRRATEHLLARLDLAAGMTVLDIGCGIGGAARYAAENFVVHVTGIDLTPEYREAAEILSAAVDLSARLTFLTGSALALPFEDGAFDAAYTIHAGMNIQDKARFAREACRVLKPGAVFGIYEILAGQRVEEMRFPVPWADDQSTSFLLPPRDMAEILADAGFEVMESENRRDFGLAALNRVLETGIAAHAPGFPDKVRNLVTNIERGFCSPWEVVCRKA